MAEHTALERHSCPACGARAEWNPGKQRLICPFCGTEAPAELEADTGKIREHDLARALREIPEDKRGFGAETRSVKCRSCHAVSVFEASRVGQNCEFCGSPELLDYDEMRAPIRPESLLPFRLDQVRIRERLRKWFGSKWLAPSKLKKKALVDTVKGLYIPYWTFDAQARCRWTADSGTYYYTTQTYRDRKGRSRTRRVRHVRWRPASGEVEHAFDDQPVPGTRGLDRRLLSRIEPFPTNDLVPYETAYLSGFVVEHYQVVLVDAYEQARGSMDERLRALCARAVPGDTHRNLVIDPRYSGQTFKQILVPVWMLKYDYGKRAFRVLANGYTGAIAGDYPKSRWKIFFLALGGLLAVILFVLMNR